MGWLACVHPVAFAFVTVAAIGILAYGILNNNQKQRHSYGGDGRPPKFPSPPPSPKLPPPSPNKGIRRRKPDKQNGSVSDSPDSQQSDSISKNVETSGSSEENSKSPPDTQVKDLNMNRLDQVDQKIFEKKVLNEATDSNDNPCHKVRRKKTSSRKSGNRSADSSESFNRAKKLNVSVCKSGRMLSNSSENQPSDQSDGSENSTLASDSYPSSYSVLSEEEENSYKNRVRAWVQNIDEKDIKSDQDEICSSSYSVGSSVNEALPIHESGICQACEENRVNTRTDPCNHCYLCLSCARRVHRVYKRCSICHQRVKQFHII